MNTYDVIIVGGGHAGIEAAHAAAKIGARTLLITLRKDKIGWMPCNPSVGGVGKGHIVFEVSALGGLMPKLCTQTYLQARMLNTKKGPAVQGLRLQIDKLAYNKLSIAMLEKTKNLKIVEAEVQEIIIDNQCVRGVRTTDGKIFNASQVVLTTGTFMQGLIHVGFKNHTGGRFDEAASHGLSPFLKTIGLNLGRLKTGTPPRLLRESIDFSKLERQEANELNYLFEFHPHQAVSSHLCHIAHTNTNTHEILRKNFSRSPIFSGLIKGTAPRYCPSIEDKISRFADKTSHHVFVEPESANSDEVYPSGLSTAMPLDVQEQYIRSIVGFENAIIARPGYAVEYDFVLPDQLHHSLEVKKITGLFLAGQINGTTGYEEAAGQGLIAGINAALKSQNKTPFILDRQESYIGVMIDDLVTLSVDEPYRMFTSRAERRLMLRQDNVFLRLMDKGHQLGMIDKSLYAEFCIERKELDHALAHLKKNYSAVKLTQLIGMPECNRATILGLLGYSVSERNIQTIHAEILYEPYIQRETKEIEKVKLYQSVQLPSSLDYMSIEGLSIELRQKLSKYKPATIAQAALIPGMTPAGISLLIFKTRMHTKNTLTN